MIKKLNLDESDFDKKQNDSGQSRGGLFHVPLGPGLADSGYTAERMGRRLSNPRALLAGLTMLGLAYFSRPVLFRMKEVLTVFYSGYSDTIWRVYFW